MRTARYLSIGSFIAVAAIGLLAAVLLLSPGQGVRAQEDQDGDGVPNISDNCPLIPNADQADADDDAIGDACDPTPTADTNAGDHDSDGFPNISDNCPLVPNADQADSDGDGIGNVCDPAEPLPPTSPTPAPATAPPADSDGDGVPDFSDNCPTTPNADQTDTDGDGSGDVCDPTGHGTIPANQASVTIESPVGLPIDPDTSVVLVTLLSDPGLNIAWVSLEPDQFTVHLRAVSGPRHPPVQFMYEILP
jgi:hypothetical protein